MSHPPAADPGTGPGFEEGRHVAFPEREPEACLEASRISHLELLLEKAEGADYADLYAALPSIDA